jgi:outer membrane protein TolC
MIDTEPVGCVVNALESNGLEQRRHDQLNVEVGHSREALSLARSRCDLGVADFITVLDGERTLLQADQQAALSMTSVSLDLIQLYEALGGGWELSDALTAIPETLAAVPATLNSAPIYAPAEH